MIFQTMKLGFEISQFYAIRLQKICGLEHYKPRFAHYRAKIEQYLKLNLETSAL